MNNDQTSFNESYNISCTDVLPPPDDYNNNHELREATMNLEINTGSIEFLDFATKEIKKRQVFTHPDKLGSGNQQR
eukprot:5266500-Amphidinium_carterae.2